MNIKNLKKSIKFIKENDSNINLLLWGTHASGKTSAVLQAGSEIGLPVIILNLSTQSPEDLIGLPEKSNNKTSFLKPAWFPDQPAIVFLDEFNRAPKYVLQTMLPFVNEHRLHSHILPKGSIVIAAANPASADYTVTEIDDSALWSRFCHVYVVPDIEEVTTYYRSNGIHSAAIQTLLDNPTMIGRVSESDRIKVTADIRSLEKAGRLLNIISKSEMSEFGEELIFGMLGVETGMQLLTHWKKTADIPEAEEILNGKININEIPVDKIDNILLINQRMVKYIQDNKLTQNQNKKFAEYFQHIPKDSAVALLKELKTIENLDFFGDNGILNDIPVDYLKNLLEIK